MSPESYQQFNGKPAEDLRSVDLARVGRQPAIFVWHLIPQQLLRMTPVEERDLGRRVIRTRHSIHPRIFSGPGWSQDRRRHLVRIGFEL